MSDQPVERNSIDVFGTPDAETEERALMEAEADITAGRLVPHAEVRAWLDDLAAGKCRPRPQPWK